MAKPTGRILEDHQGKAIISVRLQFLFFGVAYSYRISVPPSFPHDKVQNLIAKNQNECPSAQTMHCDEGSLSA
jgi:hypothetical protein